MTGLILAALLGAPNAEAAPPWFDRAGAERMIAAALPDYYAFIQETAAANPERYEERLHSAMMLLINGEHNPQVLAAWKVKFAAEQAYRDTLARWHAASPGERPALRAALLQRSAAIEDARVALLAVKQPLTENRLYNIESDMADIEMNREAYALERVMNSLNE